MIAKAQPTDLFEPARLYAEVIGDPIHQSKSPLIHKFWLGKLGFAGDYRATRVRADGLARYFAERREDPNWRGCNITIPHKQAALACVDSVLKTATRVGAINTVYRATNGLVGENSDVEGILESLGAASGQRDAGIVCLIGAGGAARAAMHALDLAGVRDLRLVVRRADRGQELLEAFAMAGSVHRFMDAGNALRGADTVINASPLGMIGRQSMPADILEAIADTAVNSLVFDMVYAPLATDLLKAARRHRRRAVDGLTMLIGQADLAFQLFFGAPAPRQFDDELRTLLTA